MSAPCSRCDCATFKGEPGSNFCLACWHPRSAHHLLVCPQCGAVITPVRIPLEAASTGEGWVAAAPAPAVQAEQQALWEQGRTGDLETSGSGEDTLTSAPAVVQPAACEEREDAEPESASGEEQPAPEQGLPAAAASEDDESPARGPSLRGRLRRRAKR